MSHIDFDNLYRLADLTINDCPFEDDDIVLMRHIAECEKCYDKFCGLLAIIEVTNETGLIAVREILEEERQTAAEKITDKLLAVISVKIKKIRERIEVIMRQLPNGDDGLCFEAPLAMASRGTGESGAAQLSKLEDIENEKTFITFDAASGTVYVQIDLSELGVGNALIYVIADDGEKLKIPLSRKGNILIGKLTGILHNDFNLYIGETLDCND